VGAVMQVNQLIGRGKYSQVYSAQRLRDGKVFAIKKVRSGTSAMLSFLPGL
jgi:serine/threonine protein kinase